MDSDEDDNPNKRLRILPAYDCPEMTGGNMPFCVASVPEQQELTIK